MNQIEALRRIRELNAPAFETRDVAALLGVTPANANMILKRLARENMLIHLTRGRWLTHRETPRFTLPELVSAPYPAYVSMQSALFHHGLIEQIPAVVYAATLARPRRVDTPLGTVSLHRIPPWLFTGFEITADGAKIASAEKALFDTLYLSPARSRLFARLPELELPRSFRWRQLREYAQGIRFVARRTLVEQRIHELRRTGSMSGRTQTMPPHAARNAA